MDIGIGDAALIAGRLEMSEYAGGGIQFVEAGVFGSNP